MSRDNFLKGFDDVIAMHLLYDSAHPYMHHNFTTNIDTQMSADEINEAYDYDPDVVEFTNQLESNQADMVEFLDSEDNHIKIERITPF